MGGADAIIAAAQKAYDAGDYRWAAQILQHLVYAQPDNQNAKYLQADAFEQLGYQAEAATWRNIYFVGAQELRHGTPEENPALGESPDMIANMPIEMAFDFLGIQLDSDKAAGKSLSINVLVEGTGAEHSLVLKNRVLNAFNQLAASADVTVTGTSSALVAALMGGKPDEMISRGEIKAEGRMEALGELVAMTTPPEFWFPIVTRPAWKG
jgi:alkyl sulfatase BDS1-like metallo-beta-lactamase superfamily hydrolase